jgi:hypothetical protein
MSSWAALRFSPFSCHSASNFARLRRLMAEAYCNSPAASGHDKLAPMKRSR